MEMPRVYHFFTSVDNSLVAPAGCGTSMHIEKDSQNSWKIPFIIQLETELTPVGFDLPHKCEQILLRAVK